MRQRNQRILSIKEIHKLLQASQPTEEEAKKMKYPDRDYILIKITVLHGLRNSEARTLKRKHIDLENNQLYIINSKEGKDRKLSIHPQIKSELRAYIQPFDREDYLFPSKVSSSCLSERGFQYLVTKYAFQSGLYPENVEKGELDDIPYQERVMPHSLRHTFCTGLLEEGVELEEVSKMMGHENAVVTSEIYSHLLTGEMEEQQAKFQI